MKKILLLGGSAQQVVAIKTAKKLGYYTVLCDFLPDNPGQYSADRFYLESTTDKDTILSVARKENIDGILAFASDPAAPTAAYVAEALGLTTNPYRSVEILCNKDKFREFLSENGFNTPKAGGYTSADEAKNAISGFTLPVIIKPVDSSGSKGATVLRSLDGLDGAIEFAFSFSRSKRIIIEEFIEKKHPYLVGGDVFIVNGEIKLWGLLNCHRDKRVNPLVPIGKSYPLMLDAADECAVKDTLQAMVTRLGLVSGSMNVELIVDKAGRVFPIDVGPRSGGNMIPDLLGDMFGIDIAEISVKAAMGCEITLSPSVPDACYATHNLHLDHSGEYIGIDFDPELEKYIYRKCLYKKEGDSVEFFDNAAKCLGIIFMKFPDAATKEDILGRINGQYTVNLK